MGRAEAESGVFRFGAYELRTGPGLLLCAGAPVVLQRLPLALLTLLLEARGELVTRERICARLWPEGTHVDFEHGVNTALKKLRRALGDSPRRPRYVETLPRRGVRFLASPPAADGDALARALERLARVPGFALAARGLAKRAQRGPALSADERACVRDALAAVLAANDGMPAREARTATTRAA